MDVIVFLMVVGFIALSGFLIKNGNKKAIGTLNAATDKARSWRAFYLKNIKRPLQHNRGKWLLVGLMGVFYTLVISYYFISTN